ncbi:MAG: hypothetical protein ACHQ7H_21080, partial [Candidatus Rokuibacteriota bacterium]
MTQLAGFLDVLLRGFGTVGLAAAVGGLVYLWLVLRPPPGAGGLVAAARGRALTLTAAGALLAASAELLLVLLVHPWALAEDSGRWPLREFLTTEFGLAGLGRVALSLALAAAARGIPRAPHPRLGFTVARGHGLRLFANTPRLAPPV